MGPAQLNSASCRNGAACARQPTGADRTHLPPDGQDSAGHHCRTRPHVEPSTRPLRTQTRHPARAADRRAFTELVQALWPWTDTGSTLPPIRQLNSARQGPTAVETRPLGSAGCGPHTGQIRQLPPPQPVAPLQPLRQSEDPIPTSSLARRRPCPAPPVPAIRTVVGPRTVVHPRPSRMPPSGSKAGGIVDAVPPRRSPAERRLPRPAESNGQPAWPVPSTGVRSLHLRRPPGQRTRRPWRSGRSGRRCAAAPAPSAALRPSPAAELVPERGRVDHRRWYAPPLV